MQQQDEVLKKLHKIETLLKEKDNKPLNLVEAANYLSISQSHLYKLTSQRKIPCHKPNGKYLYFFKYELDEWIREKTEEGDRAKDAKSGSTEDEQDDDESEPP